ncbi:MAG: helix-turn-helix transcriptional regulator [Oscillospiraceae bacterium]
MCNQNNASNNILKLRTDAGFSQEKLAQKAQISSMVISRLERGECELLNTRLSTCIKIAKALGVSVEALIK